MTADALIPLLVALNAAVLALLTAGRVIDALVTIGALPRRVGEWRAERRQKAYQEVQREHAVQTLIQLLPVLQEILAQLQPNSGSSLWDRVEVIDRKVEAIKDEQTQRHRENSSRMGSIEQALDELRGHHGVEEGGSA